MKTVKGQEYGFEADTDKSPANSTRAKFDDALSGILFGIMTEDWAGVAQQKEKLLDRLFGECK